MHDLSALSNASGRFALERDGDAPRIADVDRKRFIGGSLKRLTRAEDHLLRSILIPPDPQPDRFPGFHEKMIFLFGDRLGGFLPDFGPCLGRRRRGGGGRRLKG